MLHVSPKWNVLCFHEILVLFYTFSQFGFFSFGTFSLFVQQEKCLTLIG